MAIAKANNRKRPVLSQAKPGQVYVVTDNANGTITLSPVVAKGRKPGILDGLKPLTKEECERCWGSKADDAENDRIADAMSKVSFPGPDKIG
jgi:hypothetical protein